MSLYEHKSLSRLGFLNRRLVAGKLLLALLLAAGAVTCALMSASPALAASSSSGGMALHALGARLPTKQVDAVVRKRDQVLPVSVDLSAYDVPVGNQGNVESCVTWAIDYAMLGWYSRQAGKPVQLFNPMYTYSQIHISPGDGGSSASDALNVAQTQGNDSMAHYSHSTVDWFDTPNTSERANASNFRISGSQTLFSNTSGQGGGPAGQTMIQNALASGKPVAIGLPIRPGFDNMGHDVSAVDTDITGTIRGGHEVLAVGYDQNGLVIQNSWGTTWGFPRNGDSGGYGRLSWRVVWQDVFQANTISGLVADGPPLGFIKLRNTGSGKVEVHGDLLNGGSYKRVADLSSDFSTADAGNGAWQLFGSVNGAPELGFVKRLNTGSGKVEVHWDVLSGGSFKRAGDYTSDFSTADAGNGTWQLFGSVNGAPELGFVKVLNTGSGKVEVHWDVLSGGSYKRAGDYTSDFSTADAGNGTWQLFYPVNGVPGLGFIKLRNTGSGMVEVHGDLLSGGSYKRVADLSSDFSAAGAGNGTWQLFGCCVINGAPQLGFVLPNTGSGKVEVHWDVLSGGSFKRAGDYTSDFSTADASNGTWQVDF
jgi:Papain family cysteine protease